MQESNFIRFAEVIKVKSEKHIVSITVRPIITNCTGSIYFTDLQLQEGDKLTGYTLHTETFLKHSPNPVRFHNGVVRSGDTIIIFNLGETSSGLDCYIYPCKLWKLAVFSFHRGWVHIR